MAPEKKSPSQPVKRSGFHYCTKEETIAKMSLILLGNGNPKEGMAFRVLEIAVDIGHIKQGIQELKDANNTVAEKTVAAAANVITTQHALDLYKKEMEGVDEGIAQAEGKKDKKLKEWLEVIGLFLVAIGILVSILLNLQDNGKMNSLENKIDNLGVGVATRDGKVVPNVNIKFFPKDFKGDTTKIKK